MDKWMLVDADMRWQDISFSRSGSEFTIQLLKERKTVPASLVAENLNTEVYRVRLEDGTEQDIVNFTAIDKHFEANGVIFANRRGLHKEIRRYIDFSLS